MADLIVIFILVVILGAAIRYIVKAKKAGVRCIGCSAAGSCNRSCDDTDTQLTAKSLVMQYKKDNGMKEISGNS